ncbi:MAG: hypothetical protein LJE85_10275 [Gammaproteobacteria bacterium]|jgi:uncharacterized protein YdeI (BOF family)|nr:hypothetical protein [Gammaproteobacteria bacterium]
MTLSIIEIAEIREVVGKLLDQLKIDAYLFEVEPKDDQWEIKVECAVDKRCWETVRLTAKKDILFHGADDAVMHQVLLDNWSEALSACIKKNSSV